MTILPSKVSHSNSQLNPMSKTAKKPCSLDQEETMNFFLKFEQKHNFDSPEYFVLDGILKYIHETVDDIPYEWQFHAKR